MVINIFNLLQLSFLHNQQNKQPEDSSDKKENANNQVLEFSSQEDQKSLIDLEVKEENNKNSDLKALNQIFGNKKKYFKRKRFLIISLSSIY